MHSHHKYYVVTEDLHTVMAQWAEESGFVIPDENYFDHNHLHLRQHLETALNTPTNTVLVESLPYEMISEKLNINTLNFVDRHGNLFGYDKVVSLDHIYGTALPCRHEMLEISRVVNEEGEDIGYTPRGNYKSIEEQVAILSQGIESVLLVDDGLWTGKTVEHIINLFNSNKIEVVGVVVGVRINKGELPFLYKAVETYDRFRPVLDWVCERDFFFGAPYGGRSVAGYTRIGMYYPSNSVTLSNWASVNDDGAFRQFCLQASIDLFRRIEKLSSKPVLLGDLARVPYEMRMRSESEEFVPLLQAVLEY